MLETLDEKVETVPMAEEMAPAHSTDCSRDLQRMKVVFQPRCMKKTLAALALRYEV
jgi:hypothetical protein